jgi:hypothetical protein
VIGIVAFMQQSGANKFSPGIDQRGSSRKRLRPTPQARDESTFISGAHHEFVVTRTIRRRAKIQSRYVVGCG